jgi:hypothetical protein
MHALHAYPMDAADVHIFLLRAQLLTHDRDISQSTSNYNHIICHQ